jgi:hypothetical protein
MITVAGLPFRRLRDGASKVTRPGGVAEKTTFTGQLPPVCNVIFAGIVCGGSNKVMSSVFVVVLLMSILTVAVRQVPPQQYPVPFEHGAEFLLKSATQPLLPHF